MFLHTKTDLSRRRASVTLAFGLPERDYLYGGFEHWSLPSVQQPKRLVWNLPSGALPAEGDVWTGRSLVQSSALLVGFGAGFLGGNWFLDFRFAGILGFPALVILVALGFDLVAERTFRRRHGDRMEPVIELDNVYCTCYLAALLADNRIGSLVRSFHFRSLTFFLGPIFKMELIVPAAELERAREIIRLDRIEIV